MSDKKVLLDYGSGGKASQRLISELFKAHFSNPVLNRLDDAAFLDIAGPIAMSTDTFTVDPIFFPGGDIGSLAVHGTVNDVAMLGARPRFLSCAYLIEEGLEFEVLERIVASMARAAEKAGVYIVTGDTKVVPRGMADKIFINTTGVGTMLTDAYPSGENARPGDVVLVSGTMGDHGLTILAQREGLPLETKVESDSAALNHLTEKLVTEVGDIHVLRDPTRGGLATTLNEIAQSSSVGIQLEEELIPVNDGVRSGCSILGLDPLYLANEGKFLCILPEDKVEKALEVMRADENGHGACRVGTVSAENAGKVIMRTPLGGKRLLNMLEGEQLPRIC
ncbi:hydrogenase expression/formation protein HypE [Desulfobaculum xiamenense]|uniref:Hydrogenase expression/formation protein HypE n=1 Tax=Desulfobaculum xiamenense TaxID=995050 RepID=A0A846QJ09_9BACT|nr:hydrogenase expression/formation protein HypE [Desulfobaculum xiamenense]NJB67060.1 hydrogenase expression/formation protein HypE [Desulfobaculum xiamenense]